MKESEANTQIVHLLYQNRIKILVSVALFLIASIVITSITPKKYMSRAIIYPSSSNNFDDVISNPDFGFEIQADKIIQLLESQIMQEAIIDQFDLISYYELDTTETYWYDQLQKKYARDINFGRTKYQSVTITVSLKDPNLAANVANQITSNIDSIQASLFASNLRDLKNTLLDKINAQQIILDSLLGAILLSEKEVEKHPILSTKENLAKYHYETGQVTTGDPIILDALVNHPSIQLENLTNSYYLQLTSINGLKTKLNKVEEALSLPLPGIYIISKAVPNAKPTSPNLIWNIVYGFIIGLGLSISMVIISNRLKHAISEYRNQ